MKKLLLTTVVSSALVLAPISQAYASNTNEDGYALTDDNEEELGFGVGAVLGGVLGGPAGAFITGIAGTFIMKYVNSEEEIVELASTHQSQVSSYEQQIAQLNKQMQQAEFSYQQELLALEQSHSKAGSLQAANLLMSLQFKTGSSTIPEYYQAQVTALADILQQNESLSVDLSGYTDLLGDSENNLALSKRRAQSVKDALIAAGVEEDRVAIFAYGDQQPVVATAQNQSSYYDRRVMIKINENNASVARN